MSLLTHDNKIIDLDLFIHICACVQEKLEREEFTAFPKIDQRLLNDAEEFMMKDAAEVRYKHGPWIQIYCSDICNKVFFVLLCRSSNIAFDLPLSVFADNESHSRGIPLRSH